MGQVIKLSDYSWREVFTLHKRDVSTHAYVNESNGEIELVLVGSDGDSQRVSLSTVEGVALVEALRKAQDNIGVNKK